MSREEAMADFEGESIAMAAEAMAAELRAAYERDYLPRVARPLSRITPYATRP
jgi:hypothetical protein